MYFLMPDNFQIPDLEFPEIDLTSEQTQQQEIVVIDEPEPETDRFGLVLDDPLYEQMLEERENEEAIQMELNEKTESNKQIAITNNEPYYFDESIVGYVNNEFYEEPVPEEIIYDIKPNYEKFIGQLSEDDIVDIQNLDCNTFVGENQTLISDDPKYDEIFTQRRSECSS